jgi:hypothetical protein
MPDMTGMRGATADAKLLSDEVTSNLNTAEGLVCPYISGGVRYPAMSSKDSTSVQPRDLFALIYQAGSAIRR